MFFNVLCLGGGVALITGAQTQTMAVGVSVSAPNTVIVIGRSTVTPDFSLADLERYIFNLIPNMSQCRKCSYAPQVVKLDTIAQRIPTSPLASHYRCSQIMNHFSSVGCGRRAMYICAGGNLLRQTLFL
jgi:hypothetical protein